MKKMCRVYKPQGLQKQQFGGTSKAPQNSTIDSIGKTKTELMKNYMSANVYKSLLDQESERLHNELQQHFQQGGSPYNPNVQQQQGFVDAIDATRNQHKKDWTNFGDTFKNVINTYQPKVQQSIQKDNQQGLGFPKQGFGSKQPDTFGQNYDHSFGQQPHSQNRLGSPFQPHVFFQKGGSKIPKNAQKGLTAEQLAFQNQPATGYWNRVRQGNVFQRPTDYVDPRMTKATHEIFPSVYEQERADGTGAYFQNLFLSPQKEMNHLLTGFYESPAETAKRYNPNMNAFTHGAVDLVSDPLLLPDLWYGATKGVGKGIGKVAPVVAEYGMKAGKKVLDASVKYGKKVGEFIVKHFPDLDPETVLKYGTKIGSIITQGSMHRGSSVSDDEIEALVKERVTEELKKQPIQPVDNTQQRQLNIQPVTSAPANPFENMSPEQMQEMFPKKQFGGDLPKARLGLPPVSLMNNDLYNQGYAQTQAIRAMQALDPTRNFQQPAAIQIVAPAVVKKANQSTQGVTPQVRKEIKAAKAQVAAQAATASATPSLTPEQVAANKLKEDNATIQRGNVKTDEVYTGNTNTTANINTGTNQTYYPGYGGGRFKMKGVDPNTGKHFKIKYDTAQSPYEHYGRRGPRVVKYNIYNNQYAAPTPYSNERMAALNGKPPVIQHPNISQVSPSVISDNQIYPKGQQPFTGNMDNGYDWNTNAGMTIDRPELYQPYQQQGVEQYVPLQDQVAQNPTDWNTYNQEQDQVPYNALLDLQRQQAGPINDLQYRAGGQYFPQAYPGGLHRPTIYEMPFIMQGGGPTIDDTTYTTGPESGSYIENGAVQSYGNQQQNQKPDIKAKWKGNGFAQEVNRWAPMAIPAVNMVSSMFEQNDANKNMAHLQQLKQASNVFTPNQSVDRGKNTVNQGYFDPYDMVTTQFAGNDQGSVNSQNTFGRYGGKFQQGGDVESTEAYLDDEEIEAILNAGGQIEYL